MKNSLKLIQMFFKGVLTSYNALNLQRRRGFIGFGEFYDVNIYSFTVSTGVDLKETKIYFCYNYSILGKNGKEEYICKNDSFSVDGIKLLNENKVMEETINHITLKIINNNHKPIRKNDKF